MKKRILIGFCALFILLLVGGYIFLRSDLFLGRLRVVAESILKKQLALETSISSITGNIFKGIKVSGVSISGSSEDKYNKIVEVEEVDISYSLPSLLGWKFRIHKISLDRPKIWLERDKYGKFNLPLLNAEPKPEPKHVEKQEKKSRFSLLIDELNLSSGELAFSDESSQINSSISGINVKLDGKGSQGEFSGKFDAQQMDIKQKNISKVVHNLSSSFEIKPDMIDISEFSMQMGKSALKVFANIQSGQNPNLDAKVQTSLFLEDVKEFAPQLKRLDGFGNINAEIRGELDNLIGNLNINLPIAHINNLEVKDIVAKAEFTQNYVDLKDLRANIGNSTTKATGNVQINEGKLREYKGFVDLQNLDVNRIINELNETKAPISGYLDAQIALNGTGFQPGQINLDAKCSMNNTIYRDEKKQAFTLGDVDADISLKGKSLKIGIFRNKLNFDIEGQMNEEGKITLAMSTDEFDLEELKSFLADVPPTQGKVNIDAKASMTITDPVIRNSLGLAQIKSEPGLIKGISDFNAQLDLNIPDLKLSLGKIEGPKKKSDDLNSPSETYPLSSLSYIKLGALNGKIRLINDQLLIDKISLSSEGSECLVTGEIQLQKQPVVVRRLGLTVNNLEVLPFFESQLSALKSQISGGIVNGQLDINGDIKNINGSGQFSIRNLAIDNHKINPINIPLEIKSNGVYIPQLVISGAGEQIELSVRINQSGDYEIKLDSMPINLSKLADFVDAQGFAKKEELPDSGTIQISVTGDGNLKAPFLKGEINLKGLGYNGESFGDGKCAFNLRDKKLYADVLFSDNALIATIDAGTEEPFPFKGIVQLGNMNLEPFLKIAGVGDKIDLRVAGSIDIDGRGSDPKSSYAEANFQNILLDLKNHHWANDNPVKFTFKDGKLEIEEFLLISSGGNISANGSYALDGEMDITMKVESLDLEAMSELAEIPEPISGKLDCVINVGGNLNSPSAYIGLNISGINYENIGVDKIAGQITYRNGLAKIEEILVNAFNGNINIKGEMPVELDLKNPPKPEKIVESPISVTIQGGGLDIEFLSKISPQVVSSHGVLDNINITLTGSPKVPKADGSMEFRNGKILTKVFSSPIEKINAILSLQSLKESEELDVNQYEASLGIAWNIDEGNYEAKGVVQIPREFIKHIIQHPNIQYPTSSNQLPAFQFNLNIQNGQLGNIIRDIGKDKLSPIDAGLSGNLLVNGKIPYPLPTKKPMEFIELLNGDMVIESLNMAAKDYQIRNIDQIKLHISNKMINLEEFELLSLAPSATKIDKISVSSMQVGSIKASGKILWDETFQMSFSSKHLHPGLFTSLINTEKSNSSNSAYWTVKRGDIAFDLYAEGKLNSPVIKFSLTGNNLSLPLASDNRETSIDNVNCDLSYNNDMLNIEKINIRTFGNELIINGSLPMSASLMPPLVKFPEQDMNLKMLMNDFNLSFLSNITKEIEAIKGIAKADIRILGTPRNPYLSGKLQLADGGCRLLISKPDISSKSFSQEPPIVIQPVDITNVNLDITMTEKSTVMDKMSFKIGDGQYEANGNLELGKRLEPQAFDITFRASPAKLDPFIGMMGQEQFGMLSGEVMINGKLSGDIRKLRTGSILDKARAISGEIFVPDEGIKVGVTDHIITNPNRIDAKFQKGLLNLNSFRLVDKSPLNGSSGSSISAFGEWNIDGDKFFDATVNLDMGFISEIIQKPDYLKGLLSFRVEARGQTIKCNWPLASTQVSAKSPQKLVVGQATIDRFEGAVTYQNQEIKVDRVRVASGDNLVIINGNIPTAGKKMELRIDGRLNDMSILSLLSKDITESSGTGVVGVTITGDLKKVLAKEEPLRFLGSCSFNALNVNFPNSFINFKDLKADLVFDSQGINEKRGFVRLNSFRGRLNDGDFALDLDRSVRPGVEIIWSKDTYYRLNQISDIWVNLRDVRLYQPMVYSILLDGDVVLRGKLDAPIVAGNVILDEGEYIESLESFIQKLFYSRQIGVKAFLDYPLVQDLELNINVQVPNNMWMKNSLVNVEAKAAANVRGSLAKPIVLAQGNIIQGEFSYIGRKFTITKGEIRNENEINPRYDIVAETEVENTINPDAQGSILKVQMELKGSLSEPLPPSFSAAGGGLVQGNTEISQTDIISLLTLGTTPQNFIDRGISGPSPLLLESAKWYLESQAEKRLNLKDVKLQLDLTNSRETRLAVTKQLMQDISVLMDVGYGEQQIGLEWEINKHLAFTGKTTPKKKEWDFDLKLKQDFP